MRTQTEDWKEPVTKLETRLLWKKLCPSNLVLVALIFLGLTVMRAYGYWGPQFNGRLVVAGFLLMWFLPWILLTKDVRRFIGLDWVYGLRWLVVSSLLGGLLALACYGLGVLLFGHSDAHWYQSVAASFFHDERVLQLPRWELFWMFTIPAMLFSPIGEEIFFRGLIFHAVASRWGSLTGLIASGCMFAAVHLIHHGIYKTETGFEVLWFSGSIWFLLMFVTSLCFSWLRYKYNSLLPSMLGHACFNLVMNLTIFYLLIDAAAY